MRLRDGAIYIASKAVPSALGFATTMLLTWVLAPDEYGLYGLGLAAIAIGSNVLFDWMSVGFQRWYQGREDDPAFMSTLLAMFAGLCAASVALMLAASALGVLGRYHAQAWLFLFGTWAYAWFELASRIQIGRFRPGRYFWMNLARNGLILVGSAAVGYATRSADAVLAVNFLAMFAAGCLYLGDGSICLRWTFDAALARAFAAYAAPLGLTMILFGLSNTANRFMLGALSTVTAVANYTVASSLIQNSMGMSSTGIGPAALASAVRAVESGDAAAARDQLARNYVLLLGLLLPAGVGLTLVGPEIAALLIAPKYRLGVVQMTPWLATYAVLIGMRSQYVESAFQLGRRTGLGVQVTAVSAAVNIGLNVLLIPRWGALGAAVALTRACAAALAHAVYLSGRAYPLPMPARETWRIAAATGVMAVVVLAARPLSGVGGLLVQVALAVCAYGAALAALDVLGLRGILLQRLRLRAVRIARPASKQC